MTSGHDFSPALTKELVAHLKAFATAPRVTRFETVASERTRHLTVVLEEIYQPHNASAVLRTCDCFGIQDVHIIENRNRYQVNPDVALGASKWLDMVRYRDGEESTLNCLNALKSKGYRIVATTPHTDSHTPETLPLDQKTALVFGTELEGLTPQVLENADDFVRIPMFGFTESLNISVSAAIILRSLTMRLHEMQVPWRLPEEERDRVMLAWLRESIGSAEMIIAEFLRSRPAV